MRSGLLCCLTAAIVAGGCDRPPETSEPKSSDLKGDLDVLAASRVYFGHQSVGGDIMQGLEELAQAHGVALRVTEASAENGLPGLVHATVGRNREPQTKCEAFAQFLTGPMASTWDAVVLKFCYADLESGGQQDPHRLFALYKRMVDSLQRDRPDLLLVHATMPLQSEGFGRRDRLGKLLGLGTSTDRSNVLRNQFNDLIRAAYGGVALFDVAWAESTLPSGRRTGFWKGDRFMSAMAPEFTYDEGHLTVSGRQWVAREFARSIAAAIRSRRIVTTTAPQGS